MTEPTEPTEETAWIRGFRRGLFSDPPLDQDCPRDADVLKDHWSSYAVGCGDGAKLAMMTGATR
ncbi:MAG TPA: hypothetical protein VFH73_23225 [Polyangia bacterium]|jgi:hypothetical protein|nr:hypothetical protein [Polyangia bacterium]